MARAERKPEQRHTLRSSFMSRLLLGPVEALLLGQLTVHLTVRDLRVPNLVIQTRSRQQAKIPVFPGVIRKLKKRIGHQLLSSLRMSQHPFAAGEKCSLHVMITQIVDEITLIPGNFMGLLAEIERQSHQPLTGWQIHPAQNRSE